MFNIEVLKAAGVVFFGCSNLEGIGNGSIFRPDSP
jgi:hypothetical protein